jgi:hypothetical protein
MNPVPARTSAAARALARLARPFASRIWERRYRGALADLRTYCMFIGHARGGGSLLGALLDAHPSAIIADEIDVIEMMRGGASRDRILTRLIRASIVQTGWRRTPPGRGRHLPNHVPGQWQGRFDRLEVIGSSRAGLTTRAVAADPGLLDRWRTMLGPIDLRFVHVARNPYDAISAMILRSGRPFDDAIRQYFTNCAAVARVRARLDAGSVALVRYEQLLQDPGQHLERIIEHLGLDRPPGYREAAVAAVKAPTIDRERISWTADHIAAVAEEIDRFPFLAGYRYEHSPAQ